MIKFSSDGFTIIELMIAITILSVLLLMSSVVLTGVGNLFYKGVNMSNVQDVNRNIIADVTSSIQFSGSVLNNGAGISSPVVGNYNGNVIDAYCFGTTRYSFVAGSQAFNNWPHVLWKDSMQSNSTCYPLDIQQPTPTCGAVAQSVCSPSQSGGTELAGNNMHLASFQITYYNNQLYGISVGLASGYRDMFVSNANGPVVNNGSFTCNSGSGQQYCATSFLSTLATERLGQ